MNGRDSGFLCSWVFAFRASRNAPSQAIWKALGKRQVTAAHAPVSIDLVRIANG